MATYKVFSNNQVSDCFQKQDYRRIAQWLPWQNWPQESYKVRELYLQGPQPPGFAFFFFKVIFLSLSFMITSSITLYFPSLHFHQIFVLFKGSKPLTFTMNQSLGTPSGIYTKLNQRRLSAFQ